MRKYLILTAACLTLSLFLSACGGSDKKAETSQASEATTKEIIVVMDNETEAESSAEESAAASSEASELNGDSSVLEETGSAALASESAPAESTTEMPVYEVKPMEKTMYAIKPVNVRAGYTTGTAVLSSLKAGQEVEVTGISENGWIQIKFNGGEAYVYKTYLSESKDDVETKANAESKSNSNNNNATLTTDPVKTPGQTSSQTATEPAAPESAAIPETIPPSPVS